MDVTTTTSVPAGRDTVEAVLADPTLIRPVFQPIVDLRRSAVQTALSELKQTAAREDANLMPGLLDAARAHVTEGEIVEALQDVFGSYTETPVF